MATAVQVGHNPPVDYFPTSIGKPLVIFILAFSSGVIFLIIYIIRSFIDTSATGYKRNQNLLTVLKLIYCNLSFLSVIKSFKSTCNISANPLQGFQN